MKMAGKRLSRSGLARLRRFLADERGATAIEYGLIVALIFLAAVGALNSFSDTNSAMYTEIESALEAR